MTETPIEIPIGLPALAALAARIAATEDPRLIAAFDAAQREAAESQARRESDAWHAGYWAGREDGARYR